MHFSTDKDSCFLGLRAPAKNEPLECLLVPVPYDSTMSFQTGSKDSPAAIMKASYQLEDYDWELEIDLSDYAIATTEALKVETLQPEDMIGGIESAVKHIMNTHDVKLLGLIGGEHSISTAGARALRSRFESLSVLYLDAHADLRDDYQGTRWGHASGARRISEFTNITIAGVRSISYEEVQFAKMHNVPIVFWNGKSAPETFIDQALEHLNTNVYLSLDLDVLEPHVIGNVGNPEPGGMDWITLMDLLKTLTTRHNLVGFDICELVPVPGNELGSYAAAKIIYKLISNNIKGDDSETVV
tara:strand:- start:9788 stop:10687 length:900 start_codon:yes stop_codon:yes gene_type:complete